MKQLLKLLLFFTTLFILFSCTEKQPFNNFFDPNSVVEPDSWAPSNLEYKIIDINTVKLSWKDNSNLEEGYIIERKLIDTNWEQIGTVGENITEFIDSDISNTLYYYYRVCAFAQEIHSEYTEEIGYSTYILVPQSFSSIQTAINFADNDDVILVSPGTYHENINYSGKNITITSLFFTTQDESYISSTIIDGNNNDSVVKFQSNETQAAKLIGLTITNGATYNGGGIYCSSSNPTIKNVIISNNSAFGYGGGIYCNHSNPTIKNVIISNNSATDYGGGIYCNDSDAIITNCNISNNSANEEGTGLCMNSGTITILNSIFWNNVIYIYSGTITITYSDIQGGYAGTGNINLNPLFVSETDFHLQANSPCINAGNPASGYNDEDGSRNDMGAYGGPNGNW